MSHDLEDLLEVIKQLELRVIKLEITLDKRIRQVNHDDSYYWNH